MCANFTFHFCVLFFGWFSLQRKMSLNVLDDGPTSMKAQAATQHRASQTLDTQITCTVLCKLSNWVFSYARHVVFIFSSKQLQVYLPQEKANKDKKLECQYDIERVSGIDKSSRSIKLVSKQKSDPSITLSFTNDNDFEYWTKRLDAVLKSSTVSHTTSLFASVESPSNQQSIKMKFDVWCIFYNFG